MEIELLDTVIYIMENEEDNLICPKSIQDDEVSLQRDCESFGAVDFKVVDSQTMKEVVYA